MKHTLILAAVLTLMLQGLLIPAGLADLGQYGLPIYREPVVTPETASLARELAAWTESELNRQHAVAGYIARNGTEVALKFDKTGMGHGALAVRDPKKNEWVVYNWISDKNEPGYVWNDPKAKIYISDLYHFYTGMRTNRRDALILLPKPETQKRLVELFSSGRYKNLVASRDYDFLARPEDSQFFNCVKWSLVMVLAAEYPGETFPQIMQRLNSIYTGPKYTLYAWQRPFLAQMAGVRMKHIPLWGFTNHRVLSNEGLTQLNSLFVSRLQYAN
jgi:hypothetical protein